jgi:hypothetical protein
MMESSCSSSDTKLSASVTVGKYKQLEAQEDKQAIAAFIVERFDERYFNPVMNSCSKHGFTMMAVGCLVIEAFESFRQGWLDTDNSGKKPEDKVYPFSRFFERSSEFSAFNDGKVEFYKYIRCGILHQAEVRGGWRIRRVGALLDLENKTINAERFIQALRNEVVEYACQLQTNPDLWENLKKKMKQVCDNCERDSAAVPNKQKG